MFDSLINARQQYFSSVLGKSVSPTQIPICFSISSSSLIYVPAFRALRLAELHAAVATGWCADIIECWDAGSCARNLLHLASFQSQSPALHKEHDGSPRYVETKRFAPIRGYSPESGVSLGSIAHFERSLRNVVN